MPIGAATSSRRPRSSVGQSGDLFSEGPSQHSVDVEFRRKHSRQNKEIITENVRHKTAMKVLTDEIGVLKEEIMEVKQINRILSLQMKKMKEDQKKSCSPATVQAIDALIAAMPALQILRQSLIPSSSPLPVFEAEVSRRNILRNIGLTMGTRPANAGSNLMNLDILGEEEEGEEETQEENPEDYVDIPVPSRPANLASPLSMANRRATNGRSKTPPKRLNLAPAPRQPGSPFSKAMPRSPLPPALRQVVELGADSPTSSASSTPAKKTSASPKKKARKRRESGLIPPVPCTEEIESQDQPTAGESDERHPIVHPSISDEEPRSLLGESVSSSSTASSALTSLTDHSYIDDSSRAGDDESKRGRRSRTSVNYKEPSLAKKMRKPDGTHIADTLGRRQTSEESDIMRQSSGMRRKSVLPTSFAKSFEARSEVDSDMGDVDEIDDCLSAITAYPNHVTAARSKTPDSSSSSSTLTELPSLDSGSIRDDIERVPTPIPPLQAEPHHNADDHTFADTEVVATRPAAPLRTSPRKATSATLATRNKARRSSVAVSKTPLRTQGVVGKGRTALSDVPEPNHLAKVTLAQKTEVGIKPRTGATARR